MHYRSPGKELSRSSKTVSASQIRKIKTNPSDQSTSLKESHWDTWIKSACLSEISEKLKEKNKNDGIITSSSRIVTKNHYNQTKRWSS